MNVAPSVLSGVFLVIFNSPMLGDEGKEDEDGGLEEEREEDGEEEKEKGEEEKEEDGGLEEEKGEEEEEGGKGRERQRQQEVIPGLLCTIGHSLVFSAGESTSQR